MADRPRSTSKRAATPARDGEPRAAGAAPDRRPIRRCPRCGTERLVPLGSSSGIVLVQCSGCAYVWAEPRVD